VVLGTGNAEEEALEDLRLGMTGLIEYLKQKGDRKRYLKSVHKRHRDRTQ
jgi:hypothetical protein